ncbi:dihydrodipicolinate synthase family protein [Actinomadura rubrisoli]|uniref:Dihydrodipicolinate synthase family protein n=1 Tax=Actinomadura rubrisoli TaxID=2530368 RepID=A0A4R5BUE1_9ACTN|nr:dihydrodipicolinate synthase family protein [Actinomadura rubrisoli]TDD87842.1 dihydrodipicolinate synthase family protein [Actinomadura rubrisoli]
MTSILLPSGTRLEKYTPRGPSRALATRRDAPRTRRSYAAAHVVADPLASTDPVLDPVVDWDATLAFRHHLWDLGLGVAEAMDTAQRGMGLPPARVRELIERSCREAASRGAPIACGAGTDDLPDDRPVTLGEIERSYLRQCRWIEDAGGQAVLMASRALCRTARSAEDYLSVYSTVLGSLTRPAILHWLGDMFDPRLGGYWGTRDLDAAADTVVRLVSENAPAVDGVKVSLLDAGREVALRRRLPAPATVFTGDDFNYPELIKGDDRGHSDALLGAFDAIAPLASEALALLDEGDADGFDRVLAPTVPLSRAIFEAPTYHYKTGIVFLAYLRGFQPHFVMLGGHQGARSLNHLSRLFRLADEAGLIEDTELAAGRMLTVLAAAGIDGRSGA